MAVQISETEVRYPDISIYCDLPRDDVRESRALKSPVAVIEVLSPSTTTLDQGSKLDEYRRIASIRTSAFVDPINEMCRVMQRFSANGWNDQMFSGRTGIPVPALDLIIPHDEIFAHD